MKSCLGVAVACAISLCVAAPVHAAGGLPVGLLSKVRLGVRCFDVVGTNAAVDCWLSAHPDVANAMIYQEAGFSGPWASWPAAAKDDFHKHFNRMVAFYKLGMPLNFPQPVPTPLPLHNPSNFTYGGTFLTEPEGRTAYLLLVGNNIAAELTAAFPWSIATYTFGQNELILSMGNALGNWTGPPTVAVPGYYFDGSGHMAPSTPAFTLAFFKTRQLLGPDAPSTIANLFVWERNLTHYFLDGGVNPVDMVTLFWGPKALPISESQIIVGTTYTGPTGPLFGHFTMGCSGTQEFMKVALQAVNIPVQIWFTAAHATPIFPTVGLAMTHGDDPYDRLGIVSPVPGFPTPQPIEYLATTTQLANLCDPNWSDPTWCEHKIGLMPEAIAVSYGSDYLMNLHCQDLAAGHAHADSAVLSFLKWYYPEMTLGDLQTLLENLGMWTNLDAKVVAANFCS
jgi:hypothetical protein